MSICFGLNGAVLIYKLKSSQTEGDISQQDYSVQTPEKGSFS